ncbi:MAG: hydrolase [SAR324 cluster bacterium]|uniref:Hydrolase n=1 Tax=SAR324 cluster bacterium TaxID=2024889 RepID=A0A2A4T2D9_9DELT|nr:MAG: hydrolase [SAR324 cluster bacterium]
MKKKIALAQMTSIADVEKNLQKSLEFIQQAAQQKADLIAFPECFLFLGKDSLYQEIAEDVRGPLVELFQEQARQNDISILMGSFPEKDPENQRKIYNTSVLISRQGKVLETYRKIHLFDVELPDLRLIESETVSAGKKVVVADHEIGKVGMTICYDLRFPNLFQQLNQAGAEIISTPAAFTYQTGKAHWLTLLQARAIENQVYIAAPGQVGHHNKKRRSFGHSVIIDPWGKILALAPEEECLIYADINLETIQEVRRKMPVQSHRVPGID